MLVALLLVGTLSARAAGAQGMGAPRDTANTALRFVYLIRHGWYDGTDPRDERIGKGLDSLGRAQAQLLAERLARMGVPFNTLVSSSFTRARETADIVGAALHMSAARDSGISECTPPSNRPDYGRNEPPGAMDSCQTKLERSYARYVKPLTGHGDQRDLLVCHGNVIRWFVTRALGLDTHVWPNFDIGNCSITVLVVRPDGAVRLAAFSDTGHIPVAAQTWTGRGAGWSPPAPNVRAADAQRRPAGVMMAAPPAAYDTLRTTKPAPHR
jgi:serine/threonine-protein phosphatase PGAM5